MKPVSLAKRAAELGTDQHELVRALKALSRWRIVGGYSKTPLMNTAQAAQLMGVDFDDAVQAINDSYTRDWTEKSILDAIFAFMKKKGRWPRSRDLRRSNGLPSQWTLERTANSTWMTYTGYPGGYWRRNSSWIRPRDYWERRVAADKRCTPEMAVQLRNVLARKEAIDRIGFQTFINNGTATVLDEHPEFGTLYQLPGETPSEPMILLKVVNSTPEPDGTFADYYLRVPPTMTNAQEAVTWTFNGNEALGPKPYAPLIQT